MKAEYPEVMVTQNGPVKGNKKTAFFPYQYLTARAIVVRSTDGEILDPWHREGGNMLYSSGRLTIMKILDELWMGKSGKIGS